MVVHRDSTGSTNDDAKEIAARLPPTDPSVLLVVAETQTRGRGRGSNVWFSPRGSISMTLAISGVARGRLGTLPLGVGVCVARALGSLGVDARVKWPNDVLIGGKKVCGILCESGLSDGLARVFVGVGVNVETDAGDAAAIPEATSLGAHGIEAGRAILVADITRRLIAFIGADATTAVIVDDWKSISIPWWGQRATLTEGDRERWVTVLDVDQEGRLVVRDEAGLVRPLISGEVRHLRVIA